MNLPLDVIHVVAYYLDLSAVRRWGLASKENLLVNEKVAAELQVVTVRPKDVAFFKTVASKHDLHWKHATLPISELSDLLEHSSLRPNGLVGIPDQAVGFDFGPSLSLFGQLQSLDLTGATFLRISHIHNVFSLTGLVQLKLKDIKVTEPYAAYRPTEDAAKFTNLHNLTYLNIDALPRTQNLSENVVAMCHKLPSLTRLNMRYLYLSTALPRVGDCSTLTRLAMRCKGISEIVFNSAFNAVSRLTALRRLSFRIDQTGENYNAILGLSNLVNLEHFDFTGFSPPVRTWEAILQCTPHLRFLRVARLDELNPTEALRKLDGRRSIVVETVEVTTKKHRYD